MRIIAGRWRSRLLEVPALPDLPTVAELGHPEIDALIWYALFLPGATPRPIAARIRDETFSLQLSSSLEHLVVYTPQDKDFFCVEPVSHVSNAIHMADPLAHGLRSLAPGESTEAWMQLDVKVV